MEQWSSIRNPLSHNQIRYKARFQVQAVKRLAVPTRGVV